MDLTSKPDERAGLVKIAPGLRAWRVVVVTGTVGGYRVRLEVVGAPGDDGRVGRFECRSLQVMSLSDAEGPAVTTDALRGIPVAAIMADQARQWVIPYGDADAPTDLTRLSGEDYELMRAQGPTPRTLAVVAGVYRLALAIGARPTLAVEERFAVPKPTAGRWVAQARQRGHLGASEGQGKAGG